MKKTRHTTEQIIRILREAGASERSNEEICREHDISPQTDYRWKSKYGGMDLYFGLTIWSLGQGCPLLLWFQSNYILLVEAERRNTGCPT